MTRWSLIAAELRIPRGTSLAAHRMLVIADASGHAVRQINGLASWFDRSRQCWRHKPIGYLPSDRLRGYDTLSHPRTFMPINGVAPGSRDLRPALDSGAARVLRDKLSAENVDALLAPALVALRRINAITPGPEGGSGLPYPFLGFGRNSNAFYSTMLSSMDLAEPAFARPAIIVPGARAMLLPETAMAEIRAAQASATA